MVFSPQPSIHLPVFIHTTTLQLRPFILAPTIMFPFSKEKHKPYLSDATQADLLKASDAP